LRKFPDCLTANLSCAHFQCSRIWPFVDLIEEMPGKRLRRSKRLDHSRKDIANAALRLNYTWRIRVDLELASQARDLDIDASVENVLVARVA
jgi:hypothetical protein